MHQPVDAVGGSGSISSTSRVLRARVQAVPASAPTGPVTATAESAPTSCLRSLAMAATCPASDPSRLEQARTRLASGWYHSPEGMRDTARALLADEVGRPG